MKTNPNRRRIELNLPIETRSSISRRRFLAGTGAVLAGPAIFAACGATSASSAEGQSAHTCRVHVRLMDAESGKVTPAMACISNVSTSEVRLPPDGRVCPKPSSVEAFYSGVKFSSDPNWIGPVRKMQGKGTNNDRSYVYGELSSTPYWKEPVTYLTSGDFFIDLPAGKWRIAASHGTEFVPMLQEVDVVDQRELEVTLPLKRWIDLPARGWWSGDVHVHHPSLDPAHREFLMQYALAEDVHVVNLLEMGHHKGTDFVQAGFGRKFREQRGDFALVSGQEDPRSTFGHIIGLNLQSMVRDISTYDFYDITFRGIHQQAGALVGYAHFAWNGCDLPRGFPWFITTGEIDFIELLQFRLLNRLQYADYLNLGFRLTAAAGSDTPWGSTIGEVRTYVHTGGQFDVDSWFRNFKAGHTFVSNGPALEFTVDGKLPGTQLDRAEGDMVKVHARVLGHPGIGLPKMLTVETPDEATTSKATGGDQELSLDFEYRVESSHWIMASATCDNGAVANTTPVYVVVNGRPTWSRSRVPKIIERQLNEISKIESEFAEGKDSRSAGIRDRLQKAKAFYASLTDRISGAP
jgi:hypothetical protein